MTVQHAHPDTEHGVSSTETGGSDAQLIGLSDEPLFQLVKFVDRIGLVEFAHQLTFRKCTGGVGRTGDADTQHVRRTGPSLSPPDGA